jgi:gliding motility-associated-like protein
MGGEITWKCLKGGPDIGKYIFEMKVYRDCSGISFSQVSETVTHHNYPALGGTTPILMNFISVSDISPIGAAGSGNACFDCNSGDVGAVEEYIWRSDPMTLAGFPPTQGWHFTWGSSARSGQITNGMANQPWTLRAVMYAYDSDFPNGVFLPSSPCYDSSPEFKELAKTIICTGYPFAYSHNASDEELDEITYSWAEPLGNSFSYDPSNPDTTALTFAPSPPYSVTTPIPGNPTLDSETGEIAYNSNTAGVFVTCVKVEARKCGQLVAEIYREVQVMLLDCSVYNPPTDGFNDPPVISPAFAGGLNETTVYAGDLVSFSIQAEDLDTYTGGVAQDITLDVSGGQFSADFINPALCANPPCATFNNGTASVTPPFAAPTIVNGVFEWQTHCDHIYSDVGCNSTSNVFTFSIKAYDDFCPANGISIATIKITVVPPIPDLRCVSVQDNGDVDLTWKYIDNAPPTLEPFIVWHSNNLSGPFDSIGSVLFPATTYTHIGANGNQASQYYFLSNKDGCDTTGLDLHSDTLQSIFMDVTPINLGTSATLDWNAIHNPLLITSALDYNMYIKKPTTGFTNYLTTPLLSYLYDAVNCEDNPQFYVEIPDSSGCISKSSIGIANLGDTITPIRSVITDVSVDASGNAVISWIPSPGADVYEIYKEDNQVWLTVGTALPPNTTFVYANSNANNVFETFSVRALDSCSNTKEKSVEHNSIHLSSDLDACTHDLTLAWNNYINWDSGVSFYSVVVEETDLTGATTIIDTNLVDASNYVVTGLKDKYNYKIYIVANDGDTIFSALSNQLVLVPNLPKKPDYNYIDYASVNHDNGFVEINCLVDNTAVIDHYDIMRSLRELINFTKIGEIPFVGGTTIHYTDEFAKTSDEFYQYKIFPVDTCGIRLFVPPVNISEFLNDTSFAQTILLEAEINVDYSNINPSLDKEYTNTIKFNEYDKWLGSVSEYRLYRSVNREPFNLLPIYIWDRISYPEDELEFIDIVTEYGAGNGRFCYYIEAVEGNTTPYGPVTEGSFSNISCVSQTPIIFVPSSFTPNGDEHNEVFHPITYYVSEKGYSFTIYSRGGDVIFTTNNPSKGWDGTFNGTSAQDGNYVYHLQYINGVGDLIDKTDMITLVR